MSNHILDTELDDKAGNLLTAQAILFLEEIRKWAKFLAIIGFVFTALMVIIGFSIGTIMSSFFPTGTSNMPSAFFGIFYSVIALINFFPILYLFRFSSYLGRALKNNSSADLTEAFSNLKSHYKFIGILVIIFLCFYGVGLLGGIIAIALR